MSQDAAPPGRRLRSPVRRIVVRFADVACPPEVRAGEVMGGLLAEFESLLGALPTGAMAGSGRSGRLRPGGAPVPARARAAVRAPGGR